LKTYVQRTLTLVPSERFFCSSGYIVDKVRFSLLPENVTVMVCLMDLLKLLLIHWLQWLALCFTCCTVAVW